MTGQLIWVRFPLFRRSNECKEMEDSKKTGSPSEKERSKSLLKLFSCHAINAIVLMKLLLFSLTLCFKRSMVLSVLELHFSVM